MRLKDTLIALHEKYPRYGWIASLNFHDGTPDAQTLPEPFVEIDQRRWWIATYLSAYSPLDVVYDQLYLDGANTMMARKDDARWKPGMSWQCYSFITHERVYVVAKQYTSGYDPRILNKWPKSSFIPSDYKPERCGYIMRFFQIGCEHKHQSVKQLGNCYRGYTCRDCGYYYEIDSSG